MSPYRTQALTHGARYGRHCHVEWLNDKQLRVLSWWVLPFFGECLHRLRLVSPSSPQRALYDHRGRLSPAHVDMPVPTRPEPGKVARRSERLARGLASLAHDLQRFTARDEALPVGPAPGEEPME